MKHIALILFALALTSGAAEPAPEDPLVGRSRLYTAPDPSNPGGIQGHILRPRQPIEQILAIPPDEPRLVYQGTIEGSDKQGFRFEGLPMRKYDLVIIYRNSFYEGLQLLRGESTLTDDDKAKIDTSIQKSEPYFPYKIIHRLEGETGRGNSARAICTYYLDRKSALLFNSHEGGYSRDDPRRTFKIVILKQVGPGWQIERSRDLFPIWATPGTLKPKHEYRKQLSRIRVADSVKDLGTIDLQP